MFLPLSLAAFSCLSSLRRVPSPSARRRSRILLPRSLLFSFSFFSSSSLFSYYKFTDFVGAIARRAHCRGRLVDSQTRQGIRLPSSLFSPFLFFLSPRIFANLLFQIESLSNPGERVKVYQDIQRTIQDLIRREEGSLPPPVLFSLFFLYFSLFSILPSFLLL